MRMSFTDCLHTGITDHKLDQPKASQATASMGLPPVTKPPQDAAKPVLSLYGHFAKLNCDSMAPPVLNELEARDPE